MSVAFEKLIQEFNDITKDQVLVGEGGTLVTVKMRFDGKILEVLIDDIAFQEKDAKFVGDLLCTALNQCFEKRAEAHEKVLQMLTDKYRVVINVV